MWAATTTAVTVAARAAPPALAGILALTLVSAALPIGIAWLTKLILDRIVTAGVGRAQVVALAGTLAAVSILVGLLPHVLRYLHVELGRAVSRAAQDQLYRAVNGFGGLTRFEDPVFLDRLQLAEQAGAGTPGQIINGTVSLLRGAVMVAGFIGVVVTLSPVMAVVVLLGALPVLLAELSLSRRRAQLQLRVSPLERREFFYRSLLSSLAAAKEIRLFGIGDLLRERMLTERRVSDGARRRMDQRDALMQVMLGLLAAGIGGAGLIWVVMAAADGRLTVGDVPMFIAAVTAVQGGLTGMVHDVTATHQQLLLFKNYVAVIRAEPDLPVRTPATALRPLGRCIELDDVWFRYSDEHPWVLRGVTLRLTLGQAVALVGANGAGKSTLVKLLCRFYDPTRGAIRWDGVDLREVPLADLRRRIGAVFQDYMRYDLTGAENIGLGALDGFDDRKRIIAAARRAGADEALSRLPHGYDTLLSRTFISGADNDNPQVGVVLSDGQWQRVALARAFMRDACDLLILDEPSSGLDPDAEAEIHRALQAHRAGRTTLLISHRLGAVRDADRIVVLKDGRIVEDGDHQALMAIGGEYARMFAVQAQNYRRPDAELPAGTG